MIGYLEAHYDPDKKKINNPFCALGFDDYIHLKNTTYNILDQKPAGQFEIDKETLAVTISDFSVPPGLPLGMIEYKVSFPPDKRLILD